MRSNTALTKFKVSVRPARKEKEKYRWGHAMRAWVLPSSELEENAVDENEVPFTFSCPTSHEEFLNIVKDVPDESFQSTGRDRLQRPRYETLQMRKVQIWSSVRREKVFVNSQDLYYLLVAPPTLCLPDSAFHTATMSSMRGLKVVPWLHYQLGTLGNRHISSTSALTSRARD
jgi:hypothetical protein